MFFIFTSFRYSNKATLFAILMDLLAYGCGLGGIVVLLLALKFGPLFVLLGLGLFALAIFLYFFVGSKIGAKIAQKDFQKKIHTDPIVAYNYGADKPDRVRQAVRWAMVYSGVISQLKRTLKSDGGCI